MRYNFNPKYNDVPRNQACITGGDDAVNHRQKETSGLKWTFDGAARYMVGGIAGVKDINSSVVVVS